MKTSFLRADRRAFLVLKYGLFTVIVMLVMTFLYCRLLYEASGFDPAAYRFYILPLAKRMVEESLSMLVLVVGGGLITFVAENTQKTD